VQVYDFLGSPVRRISKLLSPTERLQKGAVEREGSLDIGDGEIDVVDRQCSHDSSQG